MSVTQPVQSRIDCPIHRLQAIEREATRVDQLFAKWNRTDSPGGGVGVSRNDVVVNER
jgi:hypothetical protein